MNDPGLPQFFVLVSLSRQRIRCRFPSQIAAVFYFRLPVFTST